MKKTMLYRTKNIHSLGDCYIYENGEYIYHTSNQIRFPSISIKYKELLDELQIPYKVESHRFSEDRLVYWSKDHSEMIPVTLPLYAHTGDEYIYSGKSHTAKQLPEDAELYAYESTRLIKKHMAEFDQRNKKIKAKEEMANFWAAVAENFHNNTSAISMCFDFKAELNLDMIEYYQNDNFIAFPVFAGLGRRTGYVAVFRKDTNLSGTFVRLKVPAGKEGIFVGRGGWQLKSWCGILGAKKIIVSS